MRILYKLLRKRWAVLEVCLSSVQMVTWPLEVPGIPTVMERPLAARVRLRVNVGLFVD